jgi:broad specificity phosphatase PhoE
MPGQVDRYKTPHLPSWKPHLPHEASKPKSDYEHVQLLLLLLSLVQDLQQQHKGCTIVLVSHGDTLSILQAMVSGTPLGQHRQYGLATAQAVQLLLPTSPAA